MSLAADFDLIRFLVFLGFDTSLPKDHWAASPVSPALTRTTWAEAAPAQDKHNLWSRKALFDPDSLYPNESM